MLILFIFPKGFAYLKYFFPLIPLLLFPRKLLPLLSYLDSTVQTSHLLHWTNVDQKK